VCHLKEEDIITIQSFNRERREQDKDIKGVKEREKMGEG
jgi:hypothetical protein